MNFKVLALGAFALLTLSFTNSIQDDCKPFFPILKGTSWEYNEFDKNNELKGTNTTTVVDITTTGGKIDYTLTGVSDGPKKKEKDHHETTFTYSCENGVFTMSLDEMVPQEMIDGMGDDVSVEIDQTEMILPSSMNVGDELPDAAVKITVSTSGMTVMTMTVDITDRKVELAEEVTTDAGTFPCVMLSSKTAVDMGMVKTESSSKEWYSATVGVVKSENYDKNGNLEGSRKLTKYTAGS